MTPRITRILFAFALGAVLAFHATGCCGMLDLTCS